MLIHNYQSYNVHRLHTTNKNHKNKITHKLYTSVTDANTQDILGYSYFSPTLKRKTPISSYHLIYTPHSTVL